MLLPFRVIIKLNHLIIEARFFMQIQLSQQVLKPIQTLGNQLAKLGHTHTCPVCHNRILLSSPLRNATHEVRTSGVLENKTSHSENRWTVQTLQGLTEGLPIHQPQELTEGPPIH